MSETLYHTTIQTNGVNLQVAQAGPRDGKLIIFLAILNSGASGAHKSSSSRSKVTGCGHRISGAMRPVISRAPSKTYALDHLAEDIVGLIDAAEREKAIVIAHDWGGMVNFWLGMKHATRLERLAVFNAPHPKVFLDQRTPQESSGLCELLSMALAARDYAVAV